MRLLLRKQLLFLVTQKTAASTFRSAPPPRSHVLTFRGTKYVFRGARFLFLPYLCNKHFWTQQNLGAQKLGVLRRNAPVATSLTSEAFLPLEQKFEYSFRTRETTVNRARSYASHVWTWILLEKIHLALKAMQNLKVLCSKGLQDDSPGCPRLTPTRRHPCFLGSFVCSVISNRPSGRSSSRLVKSCKLKFYCKTGVLDPYC